MELSTVSGTSQNQFAIHGTVDTLSRGSNVVPFSSTMASFQGTLQAKLTIETFPRRTPLRLSPWISGEQPLPKQVVSLFYDVPATSRRVTFNATNVSFSAQCTGH